MAQIEHPRISAQFDIEELSVIKRALEGARDNWYFDTDRERDVASNLLRDFGG